MFTLGCYILDCNVFMLIGYSYSGDRLSLYGDDLSNDINTSDNGFV